MFEMSVGEYISAAVAVLAVVGWLLRLENLAKRNDEKIREDCATNASVEACAKSVETLTKTLETQYATQVQMSALTGTVNTLTAQYSSVQQTLTRVENKLDSIIMGNAHLGERRGGQ